MQLSSQKTSRTVQISGICAITDDALLPEQHFLPRVEQALAAGVAMLQYRSKQSERDVRLQRARSLADLCERYKVPLIINDDTELAQQAGAQGVHLGTEDGLIDEARAQLGNDAIIGATCHADLSLALAAEQAGASYVAFGRFFPSHSKPEASAAPLTLLTEAKRRLNIPVLAIGGINAENGASVLQAGADMLAVIHAVFGSEDVSGNTRALCELANKTDFLKQVVNKL
ncbi:MAG: thiamine phosphate synthase [Pseudohongiellaceae bacterium]